MPEKHLPARPNLEQYKRQARDLVRDHRLGKPDARTRIAQYHPRFQRLAELGERAASFSRTDAQLVIAREHGFASWLKFAQQVEALRAVHSVHTVSDAITAFIQAASVPREAHNTGTLEAADRILAEYPEVRTSSIYVAAMLADESAVRHLLAEDKSRAKAKGGPDGWDALTYLCFSRYLRIDHGRYDAFVLTARALLEAGAPANTGWYEVTDQPNDRTILESAIYGAAGCARHAGLTRLLLEHGADPNDEETPYHVPEGYDQDVMNVLLESGKLNATSLCWMLVRKADWHDEAGIRLLLEHQADPNLPSRWGNTALHHAILRDNSLAIIQLLLEHGANPALPNAHEGRSAIAMAARRGRADILELIEQRHIPLDLRGADALIAACARDDQASVHELTAAQAQLADEVIAQGGTILSEFAGNGNLRGLRRLLDLGVSVAATHPQGDGYFDVAKNSTALHNAAWRARHSTVKALLGWGAPVHAVDAKGRTPLMLAVKACVDSHWKYYRTTESVEALLRAGAHTADVEIPCGYDEADELLRRYSQ